MPVLASDPALELLQPTAEESSRRQAAPGLKKQDLGFMVIVFVSRTVSARRQVRGRDRQGRAPEPAEVSTFEATPGSGHASAGRGGSVTGRIDPALVAILQDDVRGIN
jgi:hypothetical protein